MNLQENIQRIQQIMEVETSALNTLDYNIDIVRLVNILIDIQKKKNVKFTRKNFDDEIKISGFIKDENGGYNDSALAAFNELKKDCPGLEYNEDSYRTYERQAELFMEHIDLYGSIEAAMKLRAIPGFSQHHTGKAFDVGPKSLRACVAKNTSKHGFIFPYKGDNEIRQAEPWHIYYNR